MDRIPERLLLGPGPSPGTARVMLAMANPVLGHLDPEMMLLFLIALERVPGHAGYRSARPGAATAAAEAAVAR